MVKDSLGPDILNVFGERIDFRTGKVSSRDALFEKHIEFCERSTCWFWNSEVCVDDTQEAEASPEEAREETPIPLTLNDVSYALHEKMQLTGLSMYGVSTEQIIPTML